MKPPERTQPHFELRMGLTDQNNVYLGIQPPPDDRTILELEELAFGFLQDEIGKELSAGVMHTSTILHKDNDPKSHERHVQIGLDAGGLTADEAIGKFAVAVAKHLTENGALVTTVNQIYQLGEGRTLFDEERQTRAIADVRLKQFFA